MSMHKLLDLAHHIPEDRMYGAMSTEQLDKLHGAAYDARNQLLDGLQVLGTLTVQAGLWDGQEKIPADDVIDLGKLIGTLASCLSYAIHVEEEASGALRRGAP